MVIEADQEAGEDGEGPPVWAPMRNRRATDKLFVASFASKIGTSIAGQLRPHGFLIEKHSPERHRRRSQTASLGRRCLGFVRRCAADYSTGGGCAIPAVLTQSGGRAGTAVS